MFDLEDDASKREKCFTSVAQLPPFVDPKQIPSKKLPFSAILNYPFVHTVEAILPEDVYTRIQPSLNAKLEHPRYARVFMSPSDILEHDFFNTYIKAGNILLISEGSSGSDNVYTLRDGILSIELGKEIFERSGLTGQPIRSGGRKHGKERFLVELNFRLPSMLHGKKGFERIVWAFKNVLNQSLAWLFCDLDAQSRQNDAAAPIGKLHPQFIDSEPRNASLGRISTPSLENLLSDDMSERDMQEACGSISEWLAMVQLASPRVSAEDDVDPYLSRYAVPDSGPTSTTELISVKWHGLIPSSWTMQLFLVLLESKVLSALALSEGEMDESYCLDDWVESDAYEHPLPYPALLDKDESAALFRALDEAWESLGVESGLRAGSGDESAPSLCLGEQTSEATSDSSPSPIPPDALASSFTTPERATKPVPTNNMTGARRVTAPTPSTPVIPTPSGAPAHSPVPGIPIPPPTLSVNFAEATFTSANKVQGSSQALYPSGPAYASQPLSGRTMQGSTHPPSGATQAPALHQYCAGRMSGPFNPSDFDWVATAPVPVPYPPQQWSAPVSQGNNTAPPSSTRYSMMPPPPVPAPAPAMTPPVPTPSKKRTFEFAEPEVPRGFIPNPNNHGRFQYVHGRRIYLNGPKAKKQCIGGKQGN